MFDPTKLVEKLARTVANMLAEKWDEASEERKRQFRALAFLMYEEQLNARFEAYEEAKDEVLSLLTAPSTPKRWMPGIKEAANAIDVNMRLEQDVMITSVSVPEVLPNGFAEQDPYTHLTAGDRDPYGATEGVVCDAEHMDGWTCTRPEHGPDWKHWDADRTYGSDSMVGDILATWYDSEDELESLHPEFVDTE